MSVFGENLKKLRLQRNLTQDALAELLGTSKQVISRYENGQRSPKVSVVGDFAAKLGVPVAALAEDQQTAVPASPSADPVPVACDPGEVELIAIYHDLTPNGQTALLGAARGIAATPGMKKSGASQSTPA